MAERVYVHVGAPKTGTTYLQDTLWENRDALSASGVLVPGGRRFAAFHAAQAIREVPWLAEMPAGRRDVWLDMQHRIAQWPGVAVLSHEFLGAATAEQARRAIEALSPAAVHVVLTARDYVAQLPALWQEAVKMGAQRSLEAYVAAVLDGSKKGPWGRNSIDAIGILDRWAASLPATRVHVVTVPQRGESPTVLWERFAAACGLDGGTYTVTSQLANPSLGAVETDLLRRVAAGLPPGLQPKRIRHRWLRGYLAQEVLAQRPGTRPTLDPATAERVRDWGAQTVTVLAQRGYSIVGDLNDLVSAPLPDRFVGSRRRHDQQVELLNAAVDVIGDLLDRQRLLTEQLEAAQSELARQRQDSPERLLGRVDRLVRRR